MSDQSPERYFILQDRKPVPCVSAAAWGEWTVIHATERRVAHTILEPQPVQREVLTQFKGRVLVPSEPEVSMFETVGRLNGVEYPMAWTGTWAEAEVAHAECVKILQEADQPPEPEQPWVDPLAR